MVHLSVSLGVCMLVTLVSPVKRDKVIEMPSGLGNPQIRNIQPCIYTDLCGEVYLGGGHVPDANEVKVKV